MRRSRTFLRRRFPLAVLTLLLLSEQVLACPVCYGASDSTSTAGVNFAILALLGVTGSVLAGFASFFLHLRKRSRMTLNGTIDLPSQN